MTIDARIGVALGSFDLDASLHVESGHTIGLIGPNGSGKTTTLRVIAGLTPLDRGEIRLAGRVVDDASAVFVMPEKRRVAMVFQEHRLLPHLSVRDNVAFGLRARGESKRRAREIADRWLTRVGAARFASTPTRALSGGQAQRVALARALATAPDVLLLDEPMAALDQTSRDEIRELLAVELERFTGTSMLVSHAPDDVRTLTDSIVVLDEGRVAQQGSFDDLAARPSSDWVARWMQATPTNR